MPVRFSWFSSWREAIALAVGLSTALGLRAADADLAHPPSHAITRGQEMFEQHRFRSAEGFFLEELKSHPQNVEALVYLGRIAFEENDLPKAIEFFEKAAAAAPQDSSTFHWLGRAYGVRARDLGPPRGMGPARAAKHALEKAVSLDPNNLEARVDLVTFYKEAPGIVGGSKRAALSQAEEIERRDPYLGALVQGDLDLAEKRFGEAERHYRAATQLQPTRPEAFFRLGVAYQQHGQYPDAFSAFHRTLQLDPTQRSALFQLGKTSDLSNQRLDEGEQALKSYLECRPFYIMPKLSWAHRRLGNIYLKEGHPEAARQEYLAALKLDPNDKEARSALHQLPKEP